tara:strand:- start:958 stop:1158 length:201 start_codon:yes stop_codon:yes gene_type:complete
MEVLQLGRVIRQEQNIGIQMVSMNSWAMYYVIIGLVIAIGCQLERVDQLINLLLMYFNQHQQQITV